MTDGGALPAGVSIRHELMPGDIGYLVYLHGTLYSKEYGWDHTFEAYVAGPLSEFAVSRDDRERIWIVERKGVIAGSIAIVGSSTDTAQLRWFLLHPSCSRARSREISDAGGDQVLQG